MTYILYFRQDMAYLLQPECNFLHGFFRCKLPVEVVDIEVKITSVQGTHIFRKDRTTQLIKCTSWSPRLHLHPTIIKEVKTFLEVEGKIDPIPTPSSQFRLPLSDTNPNIRKDKVTENRKRATPNKFRPVTPKPTAVHPTLPEAPPKPKNDVPLPSVQHERALHGLAQAKCQGIYSRTEISCFHQITWKIRPKMNPKPQPILQVPSHRSRRKNLIKMNNPQRNADGDWVVHSASPQNGRKIRARNSNRSCHLMQNSKS